jgi:hypothetical protein
MRKMTSREDLKDLVIVVLPFFVNKLRRAFGIAQYPRIRLFWTARG